MNDQPIIVKKIKKKSGGHHGGSWKVAFADFMTAMMAFFLVMWIIGLDEGTRSLIAAYFNDPIEFFKKPSGSRLENLLKEGDPETGEEKGSRPGAHGSPSAKEQEEAREQLEAIQKELQKELQSETDLQELSKYVSGKITGEGLQLEFLESLESTFFETGSARLSDSGRKVFSKLGKVLGAKKMRFAVDGHTDAQPYTPGARYNNWTLSQDRAGATLDALLQSGASEKQVLAVRGFADTRLRAPDRPFDVVNRRVTILVPYKWTEKQVLGSEGTGSLPIAAPPRIDITRGLIPPK
ncbi:MAG: flagellar motor protein MotB [Candidatus Nitrosotenuis sp.]